MGREKFMRKKIFVVSDIHGHYKELKKALEKAGFIPDKIRYAPWSGAPMEGLLVCEHEGKILELRRTQ